MSKHNAPPTDAKTLNHLITWAETAFEDAGLVFAHGCPDAADEALYLGLYAIGWDHSIHPDRLDEVLSQEHIDSVIALYQARLSTRKPASYLTQHANFAGLSFYVDERVLIPRSPIAELILTHCEPWVDPSSVTRVLDMCTGGGCIAIALAYAFPEAEVDGVDKFSDPLEVAQLNVEQHGVGERVHLIQSDLFTEIPKSVRYDIIISNPPYVDANEMATLSDEHQHDRSVALAAGDDGLDLIDSLLMGAEKHLTPNGIFILEVGNSQPAFEARYPSLAVIWLEFMHGGSGVCLITASALTSWKNNE